MKPLLHLQNIKYTRNGQTILNIDDLKLMRGQVVGIMGPNGAGKSTLVKLMALLETPNSGSIIYDGDVVSVQSLTLAQRRKFAVAFQQSLLLNTTVFQNVAIGLKLRKMKKSMIEEKVSYWLEKFHISHLAHKHAKSLSGGEAQRVNLARAFVLEPEVLFLDEPFSALDFPTKIKLLKDLKQILETTNTTTVFISHDMLEVKYLTTELLIIINGQLEQTGSTEEVTSNPNQNTAGFLNEWTLHGVGGD
ncbi:ABC transporter ATP-binding protein [Bacillus marasmi]|uniref:ABC transporter ATP-binding protein n=1 Tax=Bacillus marasmi TaxID=1926279 RepID=UPI0011C9473C|nr:ABC transporter ATP-binding protein [Bacillus marasmi]